MPSTVQSILLYLHRTLQQPYGVGTVVMPRKLKLREVVDRTARAGGGCSSHEGVTLMGGIDVLTKEAPHRAP